MDRNEKLAHLKNSFEYFAPTILKIRTKDGLIKPFELNVAQTYLHKRIEEQLARTGKVRVMVLKGRQQGVSTYTEGRFYWKTIFRKGVRTFILTHEQQATDNLFEMVSRYYNHSVGIKPVTSKASSKELYFSKLDSGYKVGTAGTKGVGRSSTIQYFHGSEAAFWANAEEHAAGILQAVPDLEGTEVVLESTANGIGNLFHVMWQNAEAGKSEYEPIFIPWFWQPEYVRSAEGFTPTAEEEGLQAMYGLTLEQLAWRRSKIENDFFGDTTLFKQEYPNDAVEAFLVTGEDSFIMPETVIAARSRDVEENMGAKVLGIDVARFGDDSTSFCLRVGRVCEWIKSYKKKDTMETVGIASKLIDEHKPDAVFIDIGGLGAGVYDRLRELGYRCIGVNFGGTASEEKRYKNKRAEMWGRMKEWLETGKIPQSDVLHGDLITPKYKYDSVQRIYLEKKEDIKKRGLRSPDEGDALALTFAFHVHYNRKEDAYQKKLRSKSRLRSWMSL